MQKFEKILCGGYSSRAYFLIGFAPFYSIPLRFLEQKYFCLFVVSIFAYPFARPDFCFFLEQ